jgi:hypothetical protein
MSRTVFFITKEHTSDILSASLTKVVINNLSHINRTISCVLQNYLPCLSHLKVTTLRAGQWGNRGSNTGKGKNSPFSGPIQSPVQWVMEISGRGMKLTTHLNLLPRSRVHGAISPLPHMPSWLVQGLHLFLHFTWHTLPLLVMKVS